MQFLFVNHIDAIDGQTIKGRVVFGTEEPWRRLGPNQRNLISSSVVSEAIGQLVSWLALRDNNFTARPVFLFASNLEIFGTAELPCTVQLEAEITDRSEESFIFSGSASVGAQKIVTIRDCGGYMMPLGELEDPQTTRQRFETLEQGGVPPLCASSINNSQNENRSDSPAFAVSSLIDNVVECKLGESITATKTFRSNEPYYKDHFPRFPVTPIVVINEMIAEAARRCFSEKMTERMTKRMTEKETVPYQVASVRDLKIKSFIRPGDSATIKVKVIERCEDHLPQQFEAIAEILLHERRILRGRYCFVKDN